MIVVKIVLRVGDVGKIDKRRVMGDVIYLLTGIIINHMSVLDHIMHGGANSEDRVQTCIKASYKGESPPINPANHLTISPTLLTPKSLLPSLKSGLNSLSPGTTFAPFWSEVIWA